MRMVNGDAHRDSFLHTFRLPSLRQKLLSESDRCQDQHQADDLPLITHPLVASTTICPFLGSGGDGLLCSKWTQSGGGADLERHQWVYFADVKSFPLSSEVYKNRELVCSDSPVPDVVANLFTYLC